jgi:hypothetical protein
MTTPGSGTLVIEGSVSSSSSGFQSRRKVLRRPGETDRGAAPFRYSEAGKLLAAAGFRGEHYGGTSKTSRHGRRSPRGRERGRERREISDDAGRRVRSRRGAPRPGGQARRPVDETGDCNRTLQGAPLGSGAATPEEGHGLGGDAQVRGARLGPRKERGFQGFSEEIPRHEEGASTGRSVGGLEDGTGTAGPVDRPAPRCRGAFPGREEGRAHSGSPKEIVPGAGVAASLQLCDRCSPSRSSVWLNPSTAPNFSATRSRSAADPKTMRTVTRVRPADSSAKVTIAWKRGPETWS